ncbi:hypothetical protein F5883DRAFT_517472 [Diaporthe sp. PMI_573]|nr:hypothetical protein F5883DRAFT_517472 [Diaporthaceae sp. PMI_573]
MNYMRPLGFRLLKILGKGGFGMACLFEMTDVNGDKHKIVVKAGTGTDLDRERIWLRRLAGARHILQQQVVRGLPQPGSIEPTPRGMLNIFGGNPPEFIQQVFNLNPTMLGLEFMKYGDLFSLLQKAGSHQKTWKSQELWYIWHCLFRGCVALAYPDNWNGGRDPLREDIVLQEETIPLVNGQAANHDGTLVHFDIEPQNVMIGNFDDPNTQTQAHLHNVTPIVKIGDMGVAMSFTPQDRGQLWPLLRCRRIGKSDIFTPIMWQLILGVYPDQPPQCSQIEIMGVPFWTYGGLLLYDTSEATQRIDFDQFRPTMTELEEAILRGISQDWAARETQSEQKFSMRELLGHPEIQYQYLLLAARLHKEDPTHGLRLRLRQVQAKPGHLVDRSLVIF